MSQIPVRSLKTGLKSYHYQQLADIVVNRPAAFDGANGMKTGISETAAFSFTESIRTTAVFSKHFDLDSTSATVIF
jgi:hypothetical protein